MDHDETTRQIEDRLTELDIAIDELRTELYDDLMAGKPHSPKAKRMMDTLATAEDEHRELLAQLRAA